MDFRSSNFQVDGLNVQAIKTTGTRTYLSYEENDLILAAFVLLRDSGMVNMAILTDKMVALICTILSLWNDNTNIIQNFGNSRNLQYSYYSTFIELSTENFSRYVDIYKSLPFGEYYLEAAARFSEISANTTRIPKLPLLQFMRAITNYYLTLWRTKYQDIFPRKAIDFEDNPDSQLKFVAYMEASRSYTDKSTAFTIYYNRLTRALIPF